MHIDTSARNYDEYSTNIMLSMYIIKMWVILEPQVTSFTQDHKADYYNITKKVERGMLYIYYL